MMTGNGSSNMSGMGSGNGGNGMSVASASASVPLSASTSANTQSSSSPPAAAALLAQLAAQLGPPTTRALQHGRDTSPGPFRHDRSPRVDSRSPVLGEDSTSGTQRGGIKRRVGGTAGGKSAGRSRASRNQSLLSPRMNNTGSHNGPIAGGAPNASTQSIPTHQFVPHVSANLPQAPSPTSMGSPSPNASLPTASQLAQRLRAVGGPTTPLSPFSNAQPSVVGVPGSIVAPGATAGYSYQSKLRSPRGGETRSFSHPNNHSTTANQQQPVVQPRYNFHAASAAERAAAETIALASADHGHSLSSSSPPHLHTDRSHLHAAAMGAFSQASLPASTSSSLAHYASHPVTFGSQPGTALAIAPAASPSPPPGGLLAMMQPPPSIMQREAAAAGGRAPSPAQPYQYPHQRRGSFGNGYDAVHLPPLSGHPNGGTRPGHSPTPAVSKSDRAVQTSPLASPAMAGSQSPIAPVPSLVLPPAALPGDLAAASTSTLALTASVSPATSAPLRRAGWEWTHRCLLDLHYSNTLSLYDSIDYSLSEEGDMKADDPPILYPRVGHSYSLTQFEESLSSFYAVLGNWDEFDIFQLYDLTNGWPLSFLFMMIDRRHRILENNHIEPDKAFHFIQEVESNYLPTNPYHTAAHAADVLHAAFHLVEHTPALRNGLSSLDTLLLYISCAVHDLQHPGVNNSYLVNSRTPLALRYNDRSVLESHHISSAFRMMQQPNCNLLGGFPHADYIKMRKTLIDLVLATDLAVHFELMGVFKRKLASTVDIVKNEEDKLMILQIILKCGDLSHPARSRRLHLKWSELVTEEFFCQGDRERTLNLPPSMFMDRHTTQLAQSQIGFITFLVGPMFNTFTTYSSRDFWSRHVEENLNWWHEVARVEAEEKKLELERAERGQPPPGIGEDDEELHSGRASVSDCSTAEGSRRGSREFKSGSEDTEAAASPSDAAASDIKAESDTTLPAGVVGDAEASADAAASPQSPPLDSAQPLTKQVSFADSVDGVGEINSPNKSDASPSFDTTGSSPHTRPVGTSHTVPPSPSLLPTSTSREPSSRRIRKASRRSMTFSGTSGSVGSSSSIITEQDLALLSETAQAAALSAAGASATEAREHQEEEQAVAAAQAAAAAAASSASGSTPTTSVDSPAASTTMPKPGSLLNVQLPNQKRKSMLKGVAPPASPLVLSRQASSQVQRGVSGGEDGPVAQSPSLAGSRSLGVTLSERRALSLSVNSSSGSHVHTGSISAMNSPLSLGASPAQHGPAHVGLGQRSISVTSSSTTGGHSSTEVNSQRSSLASPIFPAHESMFESAIIKDREASVALATADANTLIDSTQQPQLLLLTKTSAAQHQAEFEASHGAIYQEVRQLALLNASELQAAGLTAPSPAVKPSHDAPYAIPPYSKKAHQLLQVVPRPREPPTAPAAAAKK